MCGLSDYKHILKKRHETYRICFSTMITIMCTDRLLKDYLCIISQFGLIEYMRQGTYKTTEKRIHFIDIYDKMKNLIQ
jgi:hypothetical protein